MIHLDVLPEEISRASDMARSLGGIDKSILAGRGNMAGFVGELVVSRYLGCTVQNTYQHDLLIGDRRYDVKTKRRKSLPLPTYMASITGYQDQMAYGYIFVSVQHSDGVPTVATLCGHMPRREFKERATYVAAGDTDPSNNWTCSMDCWSLPYSELRPMEELINEPETNAHQTDRSGAGASGVPAVDERAAPHVCRAGEPVLGEAQTSGCQNQCGSRFTRPRGEKG